MVGHGFRNVVLSDFHHKCELTLFVEWKSCGVLWIRTLLYLFLCIYSLNRGCSASPSGFRYQFLYLRCSLLLFQAFGISWKYMFFNAMHILLKFNLPLKLVPLNTQCRTLRTKIKDAHQHFILLCFSFK